MKNFSPALPSGDWMASLQRPILEQVPLSGRTTWKIGGPARWLIQPEGTEDLQQLLHAWPADLPRLVLGGGSNLLVDDNGFHGVVLDLTRHMRRVEILSSPAGAGEGVVLQADAGVDTRALAHFARRQGLTGMEFLGGIPGTVGGALRMNAGAYGGEMRAILITCDLLDTEGQVRTLAVPQLGMGYRTTRVPVDWIFLSARFSLRRADPDQIRERMRTMNQKRRESQPLRFPSAGSTFKNPATGPKAWEWIDAVGMRGGREGQAQVSEQHCNFLLNRGGARSRDMRTLMERIRERVAKAGGGVLALEVGIVGQHGLITE